MHPLLRYFKYEHLPAHLQVHSKPFCDLAHQIVSTRAVDVVEQDAALRKLLEAKDAFVRSQIPG